MRFSAESERTLRSAGWYPGRSVDTEAWRVPMEQDGFVFPEAAVRFLAEFHGLSVPGNGPGVTRFREAFEFDPLLCVGEEGRFCEVGAAHGRIVAPIGELDGRWFLGVDDGGAICFVGSVLEVFGVGDAGLESLVLGHMPVRVR